MKLSIIALLLATANVASAGNRYKCSIDAKYAVMDDANDPMIPNKGEGAWAVAKLKSSYNKVHSRYNPDFSMPSVKFDSMTWNVDATNTQEEDITAIQEEDASLLRGAAKKAANVADDGFRKVWWDYQATATSFCKLCHSWDDDDALEAAGDSVIELDESSLQGTQAHNRWVATWCDELQQGGKEVFQDVMECSISLYSCIVTTPNPNGDEEGEDIIHTIDEVMESNVALPIHEGVEAIQAEADAEIASQSLNKD